MNRIRACLLVLVLLTALAVRAEDAAAVKARIAAAKAGQTVTIPAGTFALGGLSVPDGVTLKGAGYDKTLLDATGTEVGLKLGSSAVVCDLTLSGATQVGLLVDGAKGATLERVRVRKCGSGILARRAAGCTVRNAVVADNYAGVNFTDCTGAVLMNATVANTASCALRVVSGTGCTIVNNLFTYAATGIIVGGVNSGNTIDRNIYIANFVGSMAGETPRKKVEAWATLSGYDTHSFTANVDFKDPANGDYHPITPLTWAPNRATVSDFGLAMVGKLAAPKTDLDGEPRIGGVDLGAFETNFPSPRRPDGSFAVKNGDGVSSAGLFTKDNRNVRYLFQNLPLPKGIYWYWLPSRDWQGRPIPAGDYVLKTTESKLAFDYIANAGNGDQAFSTLSQGSVAKCASLAVNGVAFDAKGRLVITQDGFESGQHVRAYNADLTTFTWSYAGGGNVLGTTMDDAGRVLVMREPGKLLRLDAATGANADFPSGSAARNYRDAFKKVNGIAWLRGKLYVADAGAGKLHILAGDNLEIERSIDLEVSQPAADAKAGLLWAIKGDTVVMLDPAGAVKGTLTPVAQPKLLTAAAGRLAVYSAATRKIHVFDSNTPEKPRQFFTIGTGDSGYGKMQADRFWEPRAIAISATGEIAVADPPRTCLFAADGTAKKMHLGMWGQQISYGWFAGDERVHFFNIAGGYDIVLDAKGRRWEAGTHWHYTIPGLDPIFYFTNGGQNFGVLLQHVRGVGNYLVLARMEADGLGRVLVRYGFDKDGMFAQRADEQGVIADTAAKDPILDADGKRITANFLQGALNNTDTTRDGALNIPQGNGLLRVAMLGLDARGVPRYDFAHRTLVPAQAEGKADYLSPYDFPAKSNKEQMSIANDLIALPDGGYAAIMRTATGPGPDPATEHSNGTSLAQFDAKGQLRWFSPMNPYGLKLGFHGITNIGDVIVVGRGQLCEFETMDADGLGTGVLGTSRAFGWLGMWLDNHRQVQGFTGNDGKPHLIVGDYADQTYHWMTLTGTDSIRRQALPVTISPEKAATLLAEAAVPPPHWPVPLAPRVTIKKLAAAPPVDGDLAKWRALGVAPIVMSADDPTDNSAIVRLGYTADALHVQIIKFDNALVFHQTEAGRHYQQDGVEFNIGTFWSGWKYNVTRLDWKSDIVLRDRFFGESRQLNAEEMPRTIKVLENAADVPERALLEAATGADMSKCKVMILEFALGKAALAGLPADRAVALQSGKSFLLGVCINDNDVVGGDLFNPIGWPTGYGAFSRDDGLATAVLE
jgi:hypothetical protein